MTTAGYVPVYDLEDMDELGRQAYVKAVCARLGVPDNLNLVRLTYYDEGSGPRRLVCYAKRGAAEIIRTNHGISVTNTKMEQIGGSILFTVTGLDKNGRQEQAVGSKFVGDLTGRALDDAVMTAHTRAVRRMALQYTGTGILDESEVNPNEVVELKNTTPVAVPAVPTVPVSDAPGKDVTALEAEAKNGYGKLDQFVGQQEKIDEAWQKQKDKVEAGRAAAIAQLNATFKTKEDLPKLVAETLTEEAPIAPKKRGRPRKNHVDLGSSSPVPAPKTQAAVPVAPPPQVPQGVVSSTPAKEPEKPTVGNGAVNPTSPATPSKAKLNAEQIQPYRSRLFKIVSELEKNGFAPKLGKGNYDKMRAFANIMYPDVKDFNELTEHSWETFLGTLETRVKAEGAAATGKFIEDSIGI